MILDWYFLYIISLTLCLCWIRPISIGILVFIIIMILFQLYMQYRWAKYKKSPIYNEQQLYHELQHGDVFFSYEYDCHHTINKMLLKYFNYNISHGSIVIEENGEKYVIEGNPGEFGEAPHRIISIVRSSNGPWNIVKMPLMEYIKIYGTYIYQVFRNENENKKSFVYSVENHPAPSASSIYYCTMVIGDILQSHGIISKSDRLLRYRPTELIQLLKEAGYKSFYLVK